MSRQEPEGKAFWTPLITRSCADHLRAIRCRHEGSSAPEHASRCLILSADCMESNHTVSLVKAHVHQLLAKT